MHGIVFQKPMVSLVLVVLVVVGGGGGGGVTTRVVLSDDFFAEALGPGAVTVTVGAADVTAGVGVGSAETASTMGLSG